ncbi:hypothetical protein WR25_10953 [Diploscapter pachys]|uniref:Uncharacterized protein n=1 Tax=Diploscapter pachys TaxID=2018661 RepID=A0A2A2LY13_9BILA|nr:hypothetical protein WR25_10953 [Diploscapter pachys]
MSDASTETTTPAPAANITFTFQEQATASIALYSMSLLCIILGGIRSARYVKRMISKKKLIEGSITVREAKKFPITASCVLFGLYLFFKPDGKAWLMSLGGTYLPSQYSLMINKTLGTSESNATTSFGSGIFKKIGSYLPEHIVEFFPEMPELKKEYFMKFLLYMICFQGCVALANLLKPVFSKILRLLPIGDHWPRFNAPYFVSWKKGKKEMDSDDVEDAPKKDTEYLLKIDFDTHDLIALFFCLSVGISHVMQRHWITNNIIGIAFSIYGIEYLHLSSFKAGSFLLAGLFVYDVFWVFATDVMTSVAKGIDAPILLQFPQDIFINGWKDAKKHSMLGLGDIVIPGVFIALLRRFDLRVIDKAEHKNTKSR